MRYALAPMEGVTGHVFRQAHAACFGPADKYLTPFLSPNQNLCFTSRERAEVLPEHNDGLNVVPQLLTSNAAHFLWASRELAAMGYREVNLNLGCPSGTVAAKGKGSGFLGRPEELERFLNEIFSACPLNISIKTRVGRNDEAEWPRLLELFRRYPCTELIIHPRIQKDYYQGRPRMAAFELALDNSPWPVTYNGDLFTRQDMEHLRQRYPQVDTVMLGRGVLCNPWLLGGTPDKGVLEDFHAELLEGYREVLYGDGPVLCKMKGVWAYLIQSFTNYQPYQKIIRKTRRLSEYESTVNALFHNEALIPGAGYRPEK